MTGYIGTFPCCVCCRKVRVYDWLPEAVLCRRCTRDVEAQEDPRDRDDDDGQTYADPRDEREDRRR